MSSKKAGKIHCIKHGSIGGLTTYCGLNIVDQWPDSPMVRARFATFRFRGEERAGKITCRNCRRSLEKRAKPT